MSSSRDSDQLPRLDYLTEVAKDWVVGAFASALDGEFVLAPHRFELRRCTVQRRTLPRGSREAVDPLSVAGRPDAPVAWARSVTLVRLADSPSGTVAYDQEIVEILGVQNDDVRSAAACVVRVSDLPPCLGRFWS
jgi:hypothetical protein